MAGRDKEALADLTAAIRHWADGNIDGLGLHSLLATAAHGTPDACQLALSACHLQQLHRHYRHRFGHELDWLSEVAAAFRVAACELSGWNDLVAESDLPGLWEGAWSTWDEGDPPTGAEP